MKPITSFPRIAAVSLLFGALAAGILAFTSGRSAIGSPDHPVPPGPLGVVETDGTLDASFNSGRFTNGLVTVAALQSDGKLLIGGQFSVVHGVGRQSIARLNTDGTLDLSFAPGYFSASGIQSINIQADGKMILAGIIETVTGVFRTIVRLNGDGTLDSSFDPGRVISFDGNSEGSGTVQGVVLQADGKFVVVGNFFFIITGPGTNVARSCVARFNGDGTFDPSYDPGAGAVHSAGIFSTFVRHAVRQNVGANAGKIILQGSFDSFDGHPVHGLVRVNTNGSFDSTFDPGTATDHIVLGLFAQADDKILAFGAIESFNGLACNNIVRLETSGAVDTGFSPPAFPTSEYGDEGWVAAVAQQPNGKLILGGYFHLAGGTTANNVLRLETNGARDASFSAVGAGPSAWEVSAVLVRPGDGKIFFGGYFSTFGGQFRNNIAWANPDGSVDSSFAGLDGATDYQPNVWALAAQADGKVVMTGLFTSYDGTSHNNALRVNPDGTLDPSFDVQTDRSTRAMLIQPDGKIIIAGNFDEVHGTAIRRIARLNADGTLDASFDPGTGPDNYIYALARDAAGNIYAGGLFETFNGAPRPGVAKLSSTGALDATFNPPGGDKDNPFVYALALSQDDSSIVVGGQFATFNDVNARRIARLNTSTGAIDPTFTPGQGFNGTVFALRLAPDGKYYAGGSFNTFNLASRSHVARLNSNGSLDTTFAGPNLNSTVYALALQNGKVYAGGQISSGVVRLTSTGALDSSFATGTGFGISPASTYHTVTKISTLNLQADGKLLVGGIFNQYNGTARTCLARLTGPLTPPPPSPTPPPPTPTPTTTPTATPTPTASPTPTPSATPPTRLGNISTRGRVGTGDNRLIAGFIISGTQLKTVAVRGLGPSLANSGISGALVDPILELRDSSGVLLIQNDDWQDTPTGSQLPAYGLGLPRPKESGFVATLPPGAYTAILAGTNGSTGVGLVEVYDVDQTVDSKLVNLSTRGLVQIGENVMIAGTILSGQASQQVLLRAMGPSLNLPGQLADPTLELRDANGGLIRANDNWRDDQEVGIIGTGLAPGNNSESAILETLPANGAPYTAILRGKNNTTGVALVEIYRLP